MQGEKGRHGEILTFLTGARTHGTLTTHTCCLWVRFRIGAVNLCKYFVGTRVRPCGTVIRNQNLQDLMDECIEFVDSTSMFPDEAE